MKLTGIWFPADSANRQDANLSLGTNGQFHLSHSDQTITGGVGGLTFSDRVGNIPRKITLADGSTFQTNDNDLVDEWLKSSKHDGANSGWIHTLETSLRWIGAAFVFTIVFGFVAIKYGLPWASHNIAHKLPAAASIKLSTGTLKTMDEFLLEPSELSESTKGKLQARFQALIDTTDKEGFEYQLLFRKMGGAPNAFALPSGTIIVTDRLVNMVKNPNELDAILLHEIGHVTHRHSLRQVIQSSALTVAIVMWTGDTSAIDEWATALPVFLMQSSYSKGFETESDIYAFENMIKLGIDPIHFSNALKRITLKFHINDPELKETVDKLEKIEVYLSSHPSTEDRARLSEEYSERFKAQ